MLTLYVVNASWTESAVAAAYQRLLPGEKKRVDRMRDSSKAQLTISLYVRRPLLAQATGLSESNLIFSRDKKGKLFLMSDPSWCFNLADTPGCVVLAVARNQAVGVDVEKVDRNIANVDDFIAACLSRIEQEKVRNLAEKAKKSWVLKSWVLKEAYTKRLGLGLSYGFDRLSVDADAQWPSIQIDGRSVDSTDYLALWANDRGYYLALSVQGAVDHVCIKSLDQIDFAV